MSKAVIYHCNIHESTCIFRPDEQGIYHCKKCNDQFHELDLLKMHKCNTKYRCSKCKTRCVTHYVKTRHELTCTYAPVEFIKFDSYKFDMIMPHSFMNVFQIANTPFDLLHEFVKLIFQNVNNRKLLITSPQNKQCLVLKKDNLWHECDRQRCIFSVTAEITNMILNGLYTIQFDYTKDKEPYQGRIENFIEWYSQIQSDRINPSQLFRQIANQIQDHIIKYTHEHYGMRFHRLKIPPEKRAPAVTK